MRLEWLMLRIERALLGLDWLMLFIERAGMDIEGAMFCIEGSWLNFDRVLLDFECARMALESTGTPLKIPRPVFHRSCSLMGQEL